jgi:hypothetical protein
LGLSGIAIGEGLRASSAQIRQTRNVMTLGTTVKAAQVVIDSTRERIAELGKDFVPAIAWIVGDTDQRRAVPRLAVGIAERKDVEGRFLSCEEFPCQISQALPDDILERYDSHKIDVKDEEFFFSPG